jgi:hypothetical protein
MVLNPNLKRLVVGLLVVLAVLVVLVLLFGIGWSSGSGHY